MVLLKYLSSFWGTPELSLINCKISLQLIWSGKYSLLADTEANQQRTFRIMDSKLYVLVIVLSTHDNINLLKQLESGFKRIISWNKYLSETTIQAQSRYLDFLIDESFQGVNGLF